MDLHRQARLASLVSAELTPPQNWLFSLLHRLFITSAHVYHGQRFPIHLPSPTLLSVESVERCRSEVQEYMRLQLQSQLFTNKKLYLLKNRKGPVLAMRPYLRLENAEHRKAMTRMLLSCHALAVERLRWPERYRARVEPNRFREIGD